MRLQISAQRSVSLIAAALVAIVPAYQSRSVAGAFDNECTAISALVLLLFLWLRALSTGFTSWACLAALAFAYMAATWGGYVIAMNMFVSPKSLARSMPWPQLQNLVSFLQSRSARRCPYGDGPLLCQDALGVFHLLHIWNVPCCSSESVRD